MLLPALNRARDAARATVCLSNNRQLGLASEMFTIDNKGLYPYPTTTQGQELLWFNAVDPYLGEIMGADDENRQAVAEERSFRSYKQCPIWQGLQGSSEYAGSQTLQEWNRTIKMNGQFRRNASQASVSMIRQPDRTVMYGDGMARDMMPADPNWRSAAGQFSMDVNDPHLWSSPALRHSGSANILFADGHASRESHPTYQTYERDSGTQIQTWYPQYTSSGDRDPAMLLIWHDPGRLYRYGWEPGVRP